ncbi:sialate O-acetylesterase [Aureliella helgolandensis]|uniref:Sialate O-acetylesterase domain-containing protein n=1 Tax=Aureliella helgolandensis TaxID=2527968 RepID=A0A518G5Z5_9BACT|nr:sialate O-acetylesterase [Aureliella helgolandensis]QDV24005.1 hypothetical protein Q31a_23180 [Aureliella helgolandensis]
MLRPPRSCAQLNIVLRHLVPLDIFAQLHAHLPPIPTKVFNMNLKATLLASLRTVARPLVCALAPLAIASPVMADVAVPNIFGDHMVLQQKQPNKVWGKADAGEKVTVSFGGQQQSVVASDQGMWSVWLDPMPANKESQELTIRGNNEIKIADVLVGEVWICSGQSNMEWRVGNSNDPDLVKASAKYPLIRSINYPNVGTQEPVWTHDKSDWMVCSPDTVGEFSAVGYFFGRQVFQVIDTPIGLVNDSWGGSAAEAWVSREVLEADGAYAERLASYDAMEAERTKLKAMPELTKEQQDRLNNLSRNLDGNHRPANIYNGVLKSHLGYGIRGAIWYQGESNAGRAYQYRDLFPLMIDSWRKEWGQGDFPFYWVQLADFRNESTEPMESDWAELREAQTMTMTKLPNTGEAVIIDIGEGKDIHPRNKVDVGQRLARWALANEYGVEVAFHSPTYRAMEVADGKITLSFDHVDGGWRPFDVAQPLGFTIAGADKKFVNADAKILSDGRVEVSSSSVPEPVAVRYAWADNPICNMYSGVTLPLTPFRTDDWPGKTVDAK